MPTGIKTILMAHSDYTWHYSLTSFSLSLHTNFYLINYLHLIPFSQMPSKVFCCTSPLFSLSWVQSASFLQMLSTVAQLQCGSQWTSHYYWFGSQPLQARPTSLVHLHPARKSFPLAYRTLPVAWEAWAHIHSLASSCIPAAHWN